MMIRRLIILLLFIPLFTVAQIPNSWQRDGLKGKVKTMVSYFKSYGDTLTADTTNWMFKYIYHYDTLGNYTQTEAYAWVSSKLINAEIIKFNALGNHKHQVFDRLNRFTKTINYTKLTDTSFIEVWADAETSHVYYTKVSSFYKNGKIQKFISSIFDIDGEEIRKSIQQDKVDEFGRLAVRRETDVGKAQNSSFDRHYYYRNFDQHDNPKNAIISPEINAKPHYILINQYTYYEN